MKYLPGEREIRTLKNMSLVLTTHRIRKTTKNNDGNHISSIMLESLSYCEGHHKSNQLLWIFGGVISIASIIAGYYYEPYAYAGLILGISLIISFFMTKRSVLLLLSSGGGRMVIGFKGFDKISEFIDEIESAKNQRHSYFQSTQRADADIYS